MKTRATTIWATTALALGVVVLGCLAFGSARAKPYSRVKSAAPGGELRVKVRVMHPQPGGLAWSVTRPASIHAFQRADLYAKVSGYLQKQAVDIGDRVKRGDLLAEIFAPEIAAGVAKAKADLADSQALVEVSQAQIAEAQADLAESRARVEQTQSELISAAALLKLRELQYNRMAGLVKLKAIEQELVDESFEAREAAAAAKIAAEKAVSTAEAAVASATAHLTRTKAEFASAQAQVQVAAAVLAQAAALEAYTRIRSPYDGVITARNFHEGDFIRDAVAGETQPVLAVAETDLMRVIVWVPDRAAPDTRCGNAALLRVDSLGGREFKGVVARTATSLDYETRTMRTEIDVRNPEGLLTDGMYGSATIQLGRRKDAVAIPATCLAGETKGERFVYVVREQRARRIAVQVGREDGIHAEVTAGLKLDDEVIEEHGPGLDEGSLVEIVGAEGRAEAAGGPSALKVRKANHAKTD